MAGPAWEADSDYAVYRQGRLGLTGTGWETALDYAVYRQGRLGLRHHYGTDMPRRTSRTGRVAREVLRRRSLYI